MQYSLAEGLAITPAENKFILFRDQVSNQEFIRTSQEIAEKGLYFHLDAYHCSVLLDFHEAWDDDIHSFRSLYAYLNGRGVPSIQEAQYELMLGPIMRPLQEILNPGYFRYLLDARLSPDKPAIDDHLLREVITKTAALLQGIQASTGVELYTEGILSAHTHLVELLLALPYPQGRLPIPARGLYPQALAFIQDGLQNRPDRWIILLAAAFLHDLGLTTDSEDATDQTLAWLEEWHISKKLFDLNDNLGVERQAADASPTLLRLFINQENWYEQSADQPVRVIVENWISDPEIQRLPGYQSL